MSTNVVKKTQVEQPKLPKCHVATCAGSRIAPIYKKVYSSELKKFIVVKVDEFDLYEKIQASASCTDLALLRKQCEAQGYPGTEWMQGEPTVTDMTHVPTNIHEVYELYNSAGDKFKSLPADTQAAFKGVDDFMTHLIKGDANDVIAKYYKDVVIPRESASAGGEGEGQS